VTNLSTHFNRAENWSARLPIARDIWAEVRAERGAELPDSIEAGAVLPVPVESVDVDSMPLDELERLTAPQAQGSLYGN
jgi:hypothetical protein